MLKFFIFSGGFLSGAIFLLFILIHYDILDSHYNIPPELIEKVESISIEEICASFPRNKHINEKFHIDAWSDGKQYVIAGWQIQKSGIPVFYWTGADLPDGIATCKKMIR